MYNYFGYSSFPTFFDYWKRMGLLGEEWKPAVLLKVFNHGVQHNIWQHQDIKDLMKHSEFVRFVVQARGVFMTEFEKYKREFPGIHGEAMFVGSVVHSLDHTQMDWNLEDPLWLDINDNNFGLMAEMGRIVKVGFVSDLPFLPFHKRFKGSKHPFYKSVYEKTVKFNKKYADNMDTCIVK